ncbi:hypothetical protein NDU88_005322 [Pleurodeles waltl]|uniref:Uncharacterized protein n=1 Tax=Pleurodeles waltl TaxID=8319 RepID=A0AAV7WUE1_PLEWA|nr:hypothetical protein NDU88_005322 [Pleurodeles waltl]
MIIVSFQKAALTCAENADREYTLQLYRAAESGSEIHFRDKPTNSPRYSPNDYSIVSKSGVDMCAENADPEYALQLYRTAESGSEIHFRDSHAMLS